MRRLYATLLALTLTPGLSPLSLLTLLMACSDTDGEGLPDAPTTLRAALDASSGVSLTWVDVSEEEDHYVVQRMAVAAGSKFAEVAELPADTVKYTDTQVKAGTTYRYRVLAVNAFGESPSNEVEVVVP